MQLTGRDDASPKSSNPRKVDCKSRRGVVVRRCCVQDLRVNRIGDMAGTAQD